MKTAILSLACATSLILAGCVSGQMYTERVEAAYPPIGEYVAFRDGQVHVIRRGKTGAAPVLMIHGASANAREYLITLVPELEDEPLDLLLALVLHPLQIDLVRFQALGPLGDLTALQIANLRLLGEFGFWGVDIFTITQENSCRSLCRYYSTIVFIAPLDYQFTRFVPRYYIPWRGNCGLA